MIEELLSRIAILEQRVEDLSSRQMNMAGRGTLEETDDDKSIQKQKIKGMYGETQENAQRWETFGLTSNPPAGSDVLMLSMNGNRDSLAILSAADPNTRPTGGASGGTILYDSAGTTVTLDAGGNVVVNCSGTYTVNAADIAFNSGTLTHNGTDISDEHQHTLVTPGPSNSGPPA